MAPDLNSLPPSRSPSVPVSPLGYHNHHQNHHQQSRPAIMAVPVPIPGESTNITTPPSPQSPALSSLQAAATINAGIRNSPDRNSPRYERRRSSFMTNNHHNDPNIPAPGEMQTSSHDAGSPGFHMGSAHLPENPQHHRAPSLGQIHQQLENEQEAQVVRTEWLGH